MVKPVAVGVGVIVYKEGKLLLMKRKNAHGDGTWSLPGGHLEKNETFKQCAIRETMEETGMSVNPLRIVSVSNDIMSEYGNHYVTLGVIAEHVDGVPEIKEPHKCDSMGWFALEELPSPLFPPSKQILTNYISGRMVRDADDPDLNK